MRRRYYDDLKASISLLIVKCSQEQKSWIFRPNHLDDKKTVHTLKSHKEMKQKQNIQILRRVTHEYSRQIFEKSNIFVANKYFLYNISRIKKTGGQINTTANKQVWINKAIMSNVHIHF